jgi:predicted HicB family RNase H-like nuclease
MSSTVHYRGFDGSIIHDEEDRLYHGKILGIRDMVIYHGDSPEEAERIFHQAVDEYLSDLEKDGKQPPVPFAAMPAHLPHDLQVKAALFAHENHIEIDRVLGMALASFLNQAA